MDKPTAQQLIKKTFQNSFEKERFYVFIKNLLNHIEETPNTVYQGNLIPDAYEPYIKKLERIGRYKGDPENKIDVLVVYLKKGSSLEHARTMQRNFIAWYLNGSRGGKLKDAALVAFVAPDVEDWRFSLVKMEYKITETASGRVKVKGEFTPARRYSFLVGKNENSHTAQRQLLPLLENDEHNPALSDLENTFNIETVTKEFFEEYRGLYDDIKKELDALITKDASIKKEFEQKEVNTVDFSKKLLGQIVFLYFLQKKGWFGVPKGKDWGEGDKRFLRNLFLRAKQENKNFFNDYLEPLFYQALRYERSADDDYFSQFDCKIPFLNGGLFDPMGGYDWVNTDIFLSNALFSNERKTKEGDTGDGILDVFDRYNFTVKEDEPLEKEVAIDPEMLGKVFENLLEVKDRKFKGTYYTPREIVHYMCQESLANYLATELSSVIPSEARNLKEDIETLIRYGESVVEHDSRVVNEGRETDRYSFRLSECIRKNAKLIDEKLESIRVCDPAVGSGAFLVGMMTEIIRTRNALTPYLPSCHSGPPEAGEESRKPYNFKRHAIQNCLYGVDIDPGAVEIAKLRLWLSLVVDEEDIKQIKPLPNLDYKIVCGNSLLGVERGKQQLHFNDVLFRQLEELKVLEFNETNPSKKQQYKEKIDELISQITNGHKEFDFEVYFSEVFHEKKGFDVVIANPPYGAEIHEKELKEVKKHLKNTKNTNSAAAFIDYGINRFVGPQGTLTHIVPKSLLFSERWFDLVKAMLGKVKILVDVEKAFEKVKLEQVVFLYGKTVQADSYLARKFLDNEFVRSVSIPNKLVLKYSAWICDVSEKEMRIADKATSGSVIYMRDISETKRGVPMQRHLKTRGEYPVIGGKNILRYGLRDVKGFLTKQDFRKNNTKISFLHQPKIISQRLVAHIQNPLPRIMIMATYDAVGNVFGVDTVENTILTSNDYDGRYIVAILNSSFVSWYVYRFVFCGAIRTMDFDNYYVGKIPVMKLTKDEQQPIIGLVDRILALTKDNDYLENSITQAKVREYEKQIDQMVYNLYGLTPEEIEVVEGRGQ